MGWCVWSAPVHIPRWFANRLRRPLDPRNSAQIPKITTRAETGTITSAPRAARTSIEPTTLRTLPRRTLPTTCERHLLVTLHTHGRHRCPSATAFDLVASRLWPSACLGLHRWSRATRTLLCTCSASAACQLLVRCTDSGSLLFGCTTGAVDRGTLTRLFAQLLLTSAALSPISGLAKESLARPERAPRASPSRGPPRPVSSSPSAVSTVSCARARTPSGGFLT